MSELSSFYGGRAGAAFVIVKRFDGIDIPQVVGNEVYTRDLYAVSRDTGDFKLVTRANGGNVVIDEANDIYLIRKNGNNKDQHLWAIHLHNGEEINDSGYYFPKKLAEGMVQCFAKGAKSSSEVNYGEYVLIDTLGGMHDSGNPDNGKVYRRGLNLETELAGAEYIGDIVGPKGETIELHYGHYVDIIDREDLRGHGEYGVDKDDIVPGSYIDEDGERQFENSIKYAYVTLKDEYGDIKGSLLGFRIPTLVQDYEAKSITPYEQRAIDPNTGKYYNYGLISEDSNEYIDHKWQHPFYQKWQIKIPHGYLGINISNLQKVPTKTMPKGYKSNTYAGARVYSDKSLSSEYLIGVAATSYDINLNSFEDDADWIEIIYNGSLAYVSKDDCYENVFRYKETNFDNFEEGEVTYYTIGYVDDIERVALSDNGILSVYYRGANQIQQLEEAIRWIDTQNTNGIVIDEDGTVHVYYNTTHIPVGAVIDPYEKVDSQGRAHDHQDYLKVLDWITSVSLTQQGAFDILYNNDTINNGHYNTTLNWVDLISIADDGTISFYYNSDHTTPFYQRSKFLRSIDDVDIETTASGSDVEGTGSQKVKITYNITNNQGEQISELIGNPLNYIIEAAISLPDEEYPNIPYCHLLVYYADPALRAKYQDKWVTWKSTKYDDQVWTQWVDLGSVKGTPGGVHVIKDVASFDELKDVHGNYIPPELLKGEDEQYINPDAAGWSCTLTSWTYVASTAISENALEIVADGTTPLADNQIEFSTVNAIVPGQFQIGDYVEKEKSEFSEILFYDYDLKEWYSIGGLDIAGTSSNPENVIIKSIPQENAPLPIPIDVVNLRANGFWFAQETMISAY